MGVLCKREDSCGYLKEFDILYSCFVSCEVGEFAEGAIVANLRWARCPLEATFVFVRIHE